MPFRSSVLAVLAAALCALPAAASAQGPIHPGGSLADGACEAGVLFGDGTPQATLRAGSTPFAPPVR